ncbi:hypothetical protein CDAR_299591 [Caerostris darwini]|uniref:Homing endonuclease LAGLIDADG domain-containing protein n=1 Tax=Caerostris darwini TaxID=1538125 RepID=A0AAV4RT56_9ARAC|nr:hypothetical protein CDAR_299591 [Caerostris darwini]
MTTGHRVSSIIKKQLSWLRYDSGNHEKSGFLAGHAFGIYGKRDYPVYRCIPWVFFPKENGDFISLKHLHDYGTQKGIIIKKQLSWFRNDSGNHEKSGFLPGHAFGIYGKRDYPVNRCPRWVFFPKENCDFISLKV